LSTAPQRRRRGLARNVVLLAPHRSLLDLEAENARLRAALDRSNSADAQRVLVTQELKHRILNLLAVVQAIGRQTFRKADAAHVADFSARMVALGAAQNLLIESEVRDTLLTEVVAAALAPHCVDGIGCTITGPALRLDGRRAHALTLALHELATNAAKYGALSVEHGWIEITWTGDNDALVFLWREHGGPTVVAPARRGFGSQLITRNLAAGFNGKVDIAFPPSGVTCQLTAALV